MTLKDKIVLSRIITDNGFFATASEIYRLVDKIMETHSLYHPLFGNIIDH